jgi:hypothetical protein
VAETASPAAGEAAGLGNVGHGQAIDVRANITSQTRQTHPVARIVARRIVQQMLADGVTFKVASRDGHANFEYSVPANVSRDKIKLVIADVRACGCVGFFIEAIEEARR